MKKIFILIFFVVYLITSFNLFSQCSTIHATALPTTAQNAGTSFTSRAGRYFILNVIADNTYEIKSNLATQNFCIRTGTYNGSIVAQGGMNNTSNGLVFMSSITGQVFIHVYTQACGTATTTDRTITVTNITSTFGVVNSLPYTQGFNSTLMPNNNWYGYALNMGSSGTPLRFTGLSSGSNPTSLPYESTHYIRANTYSAASGTTGRFISPPISTVGVANVSLTFYWGEDNSFSANDNVQVQYSTNGNTWINVGTPYSRYSPTALSTTTWSEKSIDLPSGAGNQSKIYIGFLFTSAWGGHMSLDKVTLSQTCTTPTNGGTISSNKSLTTVNDIISLTTSGNEGSLTKVEWSYNNFTTVAGTSAASPSNPYNIRINVQQTQVWFKSTSKNGTCPEGNSNIISVNFRNAPVYSTGIDDGDYISNVTLNNINNTSTNDGDAYQDFTSQVIELTKGEPYQLSVTATNTFQSGQGYAAWIDYNGDGTFQTTENVLQKAPANSTSQLITIPSDAATGDFLMRVLSAWGVTPSNDAYYTTGYGYGEIEEYTVRLSNPVALPVELIYFDGYEYPSFNSLKWSTASEHNSDYFKIERSTDGENWEYVGTRLASGNSNSTMNYSYLDSFKEFTIHYYRLIQMDYDGQYKIYGPISLDNTKTFKKVVKYVNLTGQEVDRQTKGVLFEVYEDGTTKKIINY